MQSNERIDYRCPECGSRQVAVDACAKWDAVEQTWKLAGTHDIMTCNGCAHEGYVWKFLIRKGKS